MGRILATHGLSLTGSEFHSFNYSSGVEGGWLSLMGTEFNSLNYSFVHTSYNKAHNITQTTPPMKTLKKYYKFFSQALVGAG